MWYSYLSLLISTFIMQPTTVDGGALEAALLSPEQLQSLSKMARILGKGMEEFTRNIASYLRQLQDLSPVALGLPIMKRFSSR